MSNINNIVNINIDIAAPAVDSANFDNLLILGPPPVATPPRPLPAVGVYSSLEEVTGAGFKAVGADADPVGVAARIAFSQSPKPAQIFIATIPDARPTISGGTLKVITASNVASDGIPIGTLIPPPPDLPWLQIAYNRQEVAAMDMTVEKDGVVLFGKFLPTTPNPNAFVQVALGATDNPDPDAMNLLPEDFPGTYIVTLTATSADGRKTVITRSVTFDGVKAFTQNGGTFGILPFVSDAIAALDVANKTTGWYVVCTAGIDESLYEPIAEWTEAQIKLFAYTFMSETDPVGAIFFRSMGWCGLIKDEDMPSDVPQANAYLNVGAVAKGLSFPAGSETWAFKRLASLYPSEFSSTLIKALTDGSSNYFTQIAGRNITMNGKVRGNEWIDVIRGRDWLQNDMQLRIFNLFLMNPKVPFTNGGILLIQNAMIASLKAARDRTIVAEDEYDEDGILVPGFVTKVPNSMSIEASQKAARVLKDCTASARLAGAIHAVTVNVTLTYGRA